MSDQPVTNERVQDLTEELRYSCDLYAELLGQAERERERRDWLLVELVDDEGVSQAEAARLAGLSRTQVLRILAASCSVPTDD